MTPAIKKNSLKIRIGIATKIIFLAAFLALIFLGSFVFFGITYVKSTLENSEIKILDLEVKNATDRSNDVIGEIEQTVVSLGETPPIQGIIRAQKANGIDRKDNSTLDQWRSRLATIFVSWLQSTDYYDQLRFLDVDGNEVVRVERSEDGEIKIIEEEDLQSKADRTYFQEAIKMKSGEIYVSHTELNREGSPPRLSTPYKPVIRYAVPVFDEETKEISGVVIVNVLFDEIVSRTDFESISAFAYMINSDGYFFLNPDKTKEWGGEQNLNSGFNFYDEFPNIKKEDFSENFGSFIRGNQIFAYSKTQPDPNDPDRHWIFIAQSSTGTLFENIRAVVARMGGVAIGIYIILFFAFRFTVLWLLKSLGDLTKAAEEVQKGNLSVLVKVRSSDEIGKLAETFNSMVASIKEFRLNLEDKVRERTDDLERANKLMVGREIKMIELKNKIRELEKERSAVNEQEKS